MKIVISLEEMKAIIISHFAGVAVAEPKSVHLIHRFFDGSGEVDVDDLTAVDRVEIELPDETNAK
jgi:hypothetical protein